MNILIGADLVPTKSNVELFNNGDVETLVGNELFHMMLNADYRIFNLELPLTDVMAPISKCGPNLIAPPSAINGYKALGVDLVTIANNHIMDQGIEGFLKTIDTLNKAEISYVGGGMNANEASKPIIIKMDNKQIGIYACCEHEFSTTDKNEPSANLFDVLESYDHIVELKHNCDYLIVLYHGGKEHYRYPSPNLQRYCRKFVDKGADLVLCQHSHCVGCKEDYKNATIIYGQGNFLFDAENNEFWQTSILVKINDDYTIKYIPLIKQNETVRLATKTQADKILKDFKERSKEIQQDNFIAENYTIFTQKMLNEYLWVMSGSSKSLLLRFINKLTRYQFYRKYLAKKYDKKAILAMLNYFECEAHREVIIDALKHKSIT